MYDGSVVPTPTLPELDPVRYNVFTPDGWKNIGLDVVYVSNPLVVNAAYASLVPFVAYHPIPVVVSVIPCTLIVECPLTQSPRTHSIAFDGLVPIPKLLPSNIRFASPFNVLVVPVAVTT